ncbi:MAG TPA: MltA domain-containing protein [Pseudolabrys sp.]|nr:MltA domain-containing protein [Pseudolabrys sp.]
MKRFAAVAAMSFFASAAANAVEMRHAQVATWSFDKMDGWAEDDLATAFATFQKSCGAILQGTPAMRKARPVYGGLYNACEAAKTVAASGAVDREAGRKFFEANFKPVRIEPHGQQDGFFTGYYETEVDGSRVPTGDYKIPLYAPPKSSKKSTVFGQYDRKQIESGALNGKGLEICYVKDPVDAFFAQIQGSTRVKLDDGKLLRLNYVASNGKPYTPVGRWLIDQGIITREEMSMDKIRDWMEANPKEGEELRLKNRSYVFFTETSLGPQDECIGSQGIALTPWRSLAVDPSAHVYGTPIWVEGEFPIKGLAPVDPFHHLMFAQDTGSAIKGAARADIYFGHGEDVTHIAGRIKQFGHFVMLVPKDVSVTGTPGPAFTPLPKPRPKDLGTEDMMAKGSPAAPAANDITATTASTPRP